ncbi:MAG TPA: Uma2 family endonuclease [Vicinamibacteria bacterium]
MKAVMLEVDPALLEQRRRLGLDRWDEMWEGVLHMAPAPADEHQRMVGELLAFLLPLFRATGRGMIRMGINVFDESSPSENYRIPDLTFVAAGHERLLAADGIRGGAPDAVIEVRSPGDESYDKLPFFARLVVPEVVILDRDTKRAEVFRLQGADYTRREPDAAGEIVCETMGVRLRTLPSSPPRLQVRDTADASRFVEI